MPFPPLLSLSPEKPLGAASEGAAVRLSLFCSLLPFSLSFSLFCSLRAIGSPFHSSSVSPSLSSCVSSGALFSLPLYLRFRIIRLPSTSILFALPPSWFLHPYNYPPPFPPSNQRQHVCVYMAWTCSKSYCHFNYLSQHILTFSAPAASHLISYTNTEGAINQDGN